MKTAKAINAPLTGDYEFWPNGEGLQPKEDNISKNRPSIRDKPKKKYKVSTLCPHKREEMEYVGPVADDRTMDVYRCRPCLAWKRFKRGDK